MGSIPLTEQRRQLQELKLRAFAVAFISMSKMVSCNGTSTNRVKREKSEVCARRLAAQAVGIRDDKTATAYLKHPIVVEEIRKHFEALLLKYKKSADDVLDGIAQMAFPDAATKPTGSMSYGDRLRALGMLAQHHKLINRASEGDEDSEEYIRVYIPDNKRNPNTKQVLVGVNFVNTPDKDKKELIEAPHQ